MIEVKELVGSLERFIRYFAGGLVGVLVFVWLAPPIWAARVTRAPSISVGVAFMMGMCTYLVHRSLLLPLWDKLNPLIQKCPLFRWAWGIGKPEALLAVSRWTNASWAQYFAAVVDGEWQREHPDRPELLAAEAAVRKGLDEWGAHLHFLFCAGYTAVGGVIAAWGAGAPWRSRSWISLALALLLLLSAVIGNMRKLAVEGRSIALPKVVDGA